MRYFIKLAYHGKHFHGWQKQPNAISVQESIEQALSLLLKTKIDVVGCGRTDAGVHASQYFLHFDAAEKFEEDELTYRLNAILNKHVVIDKIFKVPNDAHARFDAISRSYEYKIYLGNSPFINGLSWQINNKSFDIDKMNQAAALLLEFENFKCFSRSKTDVKTYNCHIEKALWIKDDKDLTFYITANRFLRNMVRAIVGTLLDVGLNKTSIAEFKEIIESKDRTKAGASAKAKGLYLSEIKYPSKILKELNV